MKLGVFTVLFQHLTLEETLDRVASLGLEAVELGTGNYPGNSHCDPAILLSDPARVEHLLAAVRDRGLVISALSQHGNPLHPQQEIADAAHETWRRTVELANALEVRVVNAFPGCPGDHAGARWPNWVTCAWPPDYLEVLNWQWEERIIPYWCEQAEFAQRHGVTVGFEMHPGFPVYNPATLLRLRDAAGPAIGCNFDPSHLFWQGIDPLIAIKELGRAGAIVHVHAKDLRVDPANAARNGVLETTPYTNVLDRGWSFRTVGYGHGSGFWRDVVSTLRAVGYDSVMSIEHEDPLASIDEGLAKAIALLSGVMLTEDPAEIWWA